MKYSDGEKIPRVSLSGREARRILTRAARLKLATDWFSGSRSRQNSKLQQNSAALCESAKRVFMNRNPALTKLSISPNAVESQSSNNKVAAAFRDKVSKMIVKMIVETLISPMASRA